MTTPLRDQVQSLEVEVARLEDALSAADERVKHAEQERRRSAEFADTCEALGKKFAMECDRANARIKLVEAENAEIRTELEQHRLDLADAAGGLMVVIPAPGTVEAKLLRANVLLRHERDAARGERGEARVIADQLKARIRELEVLNERFNAETQAGVKECQALEAENNRLEVLSGDLQVAARAPLLVLNIESVRIRIALDPREAP